MPSSSEIFELKVLVEAEDWHDVASLMASVDRALDPHHRVRSGDRRWSVVAQRLPAWHARELLGFVGRHQRAASIAEDDARAKTEL